MSQQARVDTPAFAVEEEIGVEPEETALPLLQELSNELATEATADTAAEVVASEPDDLWQRIREGFRLKDYDHQAVASSIAWYARHQSYLDRVADRAAPYLHLIVEAVESRDLPGELALLPVVESAFQPFAYSHGRAAGLWQFVPGTGRRFGLKQDWWYDGRRDVVESTRAALEYLEYLHGHFQGDWLLALAAYNSGEGTVRSAIRKNRKRGKPTDFWSLDLPRETRGYVPRLLAISAIVGDPAKYEVTLKPISNQPVLAVVDVGSQIDLALAAELCEISIEELYRYNPAFNRWATNPNGPHTLLVPMEKAGVFEERLSELPPQQRVRWERHRIKSGESLEGIAAKYRTTVALLKQINGLRGHLIRAGDSLIIPVAREDLSSYRLSAEQRRRSTQARPREGNRIDYIVREGDTLWDIARSHKVGVQQLASWNGMAPRDPLLPGKRLVIWTKVDAADLAPVSFTAPPQEVTHRRIAYTVRSGDSLARISQRFRVSINDLRRWNNLKEGVYLQPGQHLMLYVDVTTQAGNI